MRTISIGLLLLLIGGSANAEQLCGEVTPDQVAALDLAHEAFIQRTGETLNRTEWVFSGIKRLALEEILLAEDTKLQAIQVAAQAEAIRASQEAMANTDVAKKEIIEQSEAW